MAHFSARDRQPGNIIIVPDDNAIGGERAKLLDFGIAKAVFGGGGGEGTLTSAGDQQPGTFVIFRCARR